uniref:Uncharacterized protein n=1 Tax=Arundo donax TaxID=35708 RepID=A0A0A9APY3_ARUDO
MYVAAWFCGKDHRMCHCCCYICYDKYRKYSILDVQPQMAKRWAMRDPNHLQEHILYVSMFLGQKRGVIQLVVCIWHQTINKHAVSCIVEYKASQVHYK